MATILKPLVMGFLQKERIFGKEGWGTRSLEGIDLQSGFGVVGIIDESGSSKTL